MAVEMMPQLGFKKVSEVKQLLKLLKPGRNRPPGIKKSKKEKVTMDDLKDKKVDAFPDVPEDQLL